MRLEAELAGLAPGRETLLTVGVFDGVHLGHRHLISKLVEAASQEDLLPGVVTFRQHPQELFSPGVKLPLLTDFEERTNLLKEAGVELVIPLSFTSELARLSARRFVGLLQEHLRMRGLVIGPDFALGKEREGDVAALRKLGREMHFSVTMVPPLMIGGEAVSSTAIRKALADGDVKRAYALAGHHLSLHGGVVSGAGRGAGLGFPTANLNVSPEQALPADGVYASWAHVNGQTYPSLTNIGKCPTFAGVERRVEVHVLDYHGDLYGRDLKVDVVERLRDERRFNTVEELKKQMREDARQGRAILDSARRN
ncbi:MAG: bifunctional riboflavin kinase/FAD synthetase [Chloroflexi bacterium]|nr:bifunctional riboflavin kinase/FAD synthetase [Chloroflexota bacterium]